MRLILCVSAGMLYTGCAASPAWERPAATARAHDGSGGSRTDAADAVQASRAVDGVPADRRGADAGERTACANDADCPVARPVCLEFDRDGLQAHDHADASSFEAWDRLCVSACAADGECPRGWHCAGRAEYARTVVQPDGSGVMQVEAHRTCSPVPEYGSRAIGDPCTDDADCAREGPFCVNGRCSPSCPPCPVGYECRSLQHTRIPGALESVPVCVPGP